MGSHAHRALVGVSPHAAFPFYVRGAVGEYDAIMGALRECLFTASKEGKSLRVLDIGAGNGHFLPRLVQALHVTEYVAYEEEPGLVEELKEVVKVKCVGNPCFGLTALLRRM